MAVPFEEVADNVNLFKNNKNIPLILPIEAKSLVRNARPNVKPIRYI
jgi:hypothetical protein